MKLYLRLFALVLFLHGSQGVSIGLPPQRPIPENEWEDLEGYHLIAVLDEVIETEFIFLVTVRGNPNDPAAEELGLEFASTPVFRVTASFSRFLKRPDGFEFLMLEPDGTYAFYLKGSVMKHSTLGNGSPDALLPKEQLPSRGDILLIQIEERRWFEGSKIAPYLYDTKPGENEQDIIEGLRTWKEKDEAWHLEWQQMKEMSNPVQETPAKAAAPDL